MAHTRPRLLLVDDDPAFIHGLHALLGADFELRYALSGEAALQLAQQWSPTLMLLDAQMPGMSGSELMARLRAEPGLAQMPVIFVTALAADAAEVMALELGAAGVLTKPVAREPLLRCVQQALARVENGTAAGGTAAAGTDGGAATAAAAEAGRPLILIVDDDPGAVRTIHAALAALEAEFRFATSGEQALALAAATPPALVLLDMYMPGLDGLATLRAIRADPALADTQVVVVTRFADPEMETRALEAGGVDFITKPYTQAVLRARVGNLLRLREHGRAQQAAERERWQRIGSARLARVVAAASDAIVSADAEGRVVLINQAACRLFGVDVAHTIGAPLATLLPGLPLQAAAGTLQRHRLRLHAAGGAQVPVEYSVSRLEAGADRITTVVLRDLSESERRESEERAKLAAEAALRAKTMMLSYVAHEIGNPLAAIIGMTRLLQDESHELGVDRNRLLRLMAESGDHLRVLMRDVLDMQRLESGRFDMKLVPVAPGAAAARALDVLRNDAAADGTELLLEVDEGLPLVLADPTRLQQCLLNLLSNAVKYGSRPGQPPRVRLHCGRQDGQVRFTVQDEGEGLDEEQQRQLFEPFNRLGRSGGPGAGVGLALTRLLAVAMGGGVSLHSARGTGSCFVIHLPATEAPASASASASASAPAVSSGPATLP